MHFENWQIGPPHRIGQRLEWAQEFRNRELLFSSCTEGFFFHPECHNDSEFLYLFCKRCTFTHHRIDPFLHDRRRLVPIHRELKNKAFGLGVCQGFFFIRFCKMRFRFTPHFVQVTNCYSLFPFYGCEEKLLSRGRLNRWMANHHHCFHITRFLSVKVLLEEHSCYRQNTEWQTVMPHHPLRMLGDAIHAGNLFQ